MSSERRSSTSRSIGLSESDEYLTLKTRQSFRKISRIFSQNKSYLFNFVAIWYILTIWKVVFANKSRKLGWIWMKLGRWGRGLKVKRLSLARFQQNRAMGFWESAKKICRRGVVFLSREPRTTFATFLDRFPPNFPRTRVQVASRDTWFHIPEKFPVRGRISRKTLFFRVL